MEILTFTINMHASVIHSVTLIFLLAKEDYRMSEN